MVNAVALELPTHVYCGSCGEAREYFVEPMTSDDLNASPWGDMVCNTCHFVIATFSNPV